MTGKHGCAVTLRRANPNQPWGIRIVGGCDLDKPIVIIRAVAGTPAEGLVKPGDEILQIGDYDARDIRHQDAQGLFKNAGNSIKIVIHRAGGGSTSSRSREQSVDPLGLPRALGSLPEYQSNTISPTCGPNPAIISHSRASSVCSTYDEERSGLEQISHKQFNSPMGLYSEQNIVDTINQQSGAQAPVNVPAPAPFKKTVVYDPAKSETFKALQDNAHGYDNTVHEVTPVPSKVFTPVKQARNTPAPHPVPAPHSLQGQSNEEIQQSYTFKRLMHMVQSEEGVY
uniref:PDZ and LIM domain protein Zasp n=1 Tax=Lygus hesperus TaxID=30085 RepID=A0A0A9VQK1_LYGHE